MSKWFRPRRYGYGATPFKWQGWAMIAAFLLVCAVVVIALSALTPPIIGIIGFILFMAAAVPTFVVLVKRRTDGEWRWRQGNGQ